MRMAKHFPEAAASFWSSFFTSSSSIESAWPVRNQTGSAISVSPRITAAATCRFTFSCRHVRDGCGPTCASRASRAACMRSQHGQTLLPAGKVGIFRRSFCSAATGTIVSHHVRHVCANFLRSELCSWQHTESSRSMGIDANVGGSSSSSSSSSNGFRLILSSRGKRGSTNT